MKKLIYLIVLALVLGMVLTGCFLSNVGQVPTSEQSGITYLTKGPSPVLVARWNFDEGSGTTANDISGNNNHGTVYGATYVDDMFGKALSFDGNDYVTVPDSSGLDITGVITIEAWIYPTAVSGYRCIVAKRLDNFANYALRLNGGKVEFYYSGPSATGTVTDWNVWATTLSVVSIGSWQHVAVAFTFSGGPIAVYVDGGVPKSGSWIAGDASDAAAPNDYLLRIGMAYPGYTQYFVGKIDEVRIWSSVLDTSQLDDMLPPVITINPPKADNTYLLDESATLSVTDGTGSPPGNGVTGVATASPANGSPIDTSTVGSHTFTVTATDYAKNEGTEEVEVTYYVEYGFKGLLPPYAPPEEKVFKLGRTIPLKWQYTDFDGIVVDSAGANPTVEWAYIGSGSGSGNLEEEDAPGASGLRYDDLTMTWQFNWQTKGREVGLYKITITSNQAESSIAFPIELRK